MTTHSLTSPQVTLRDRVLVLTLPDAVNPVIWQMDLGHVRSAALGVVSHADHWQVRCRGDDGVIQDIALYPTRDQAMHVLTMIHSAIAAPDEPAKPKAGPRHILLAGVTVVVFITLISTLATLIPPIDLSQDTPAAAAPVAPGQSAPPPSNEPRNADDVLQNRGGTP